MDTARNAVELAGRILLSFIFLSAGIKKIVGFAGTKGYMLGKPVFQMLGDSLTTLFLVGAIVLLIAGSVLVISGFKAHWGALALIVFLVPTTVIFHNFWALEGREAGMQQIAFMKNLAILGGLCIVATRGAGAISLDAWRGTHEAPEEP